MVILYYIPNLASKGKGCNELYAKILFGVFGSCLVSDCTQVLWLASTATFIPPLNSGIMELESTTLQGQRHGVGTGGERGTEQQGERTVLKGEAGNGKGTAKGDPDRDEEANGEGKRKWNCWWGALKSTGGSAKEEVPIRFGTYNIRNGRNGGLESALRGMSQANMDLGIFQETKRTDGIYTRESVGYCVVATDSPSRHRGGVALFYRPLPLLAVEAV